MAVIVHIQEVTSTQVTEVTAETVEDALWAYAHNAAANWDSFECAKRTWYPRRRKTTKWMEFCFSTEYLILKHTYGNRFTAEWVNM